MRRLFSFLTLILSGLAGGALAQSVANGVIAQGLAASFALFSSFGTLTISGDNTSPLNAVQTINVTANGNSSTAPPGQGLNYWYFRDQVNAGTGLIADLMIRDQFGGAQSTGNRFGIFDFFSVDQQPSSSDPSIQNYTAATMQSYASTPTVSGLTGGVGYGATQYAGSLWATDDNVWLNSTATNWQYLAGHEIGVAIYSGGSVADRWGLPIYAGGDVAGNMDDAGILIAGSGSSASANWKTGIEFGGLRHNWGVQSSGTIIGSVARAYGGSSPQNALYGLDFSSVAFSSGGAPVVMPLITPTTSSTACKTGSLEWDASYLYVCTATNTWKRAALATF